MRFVSTNSTESPVGIDEAVNRCVAADGGMFMPQHIPTIPRAFFNNIAEMNFRDIAFVVLSTLLEGDIDPARLKAIVDESFSFDIPVRRLGDKTWILELFGGPTLTFKDFGARFMARLMRHLDSRADAPVRNVVVATTGNTGAAAANGFYRLDGINVTVLYPKGCLSRQQIAQFTALGENIHPVEVLGTVEDCKRLVQAAIADPSMAPLHITGANSINIARLLPQVAFSFYGYSRLVAEGVRDADKAVYTMPCGNLSNLVATAIAGRMGLPVGHIIGATNANDQLAPLLAGNPDDTGHGAPQRTLAPSIDMSHPSGWPRLKSLYGGDTSAMRRDISAISVPDAEISATIMRYRAEYGYTPDPHTAVALAAAEAYPSDAPRVVFATGHPAKHLDIMTGITGAMIDLPVQLNSFMTPRRHSTIIPPTLPALKKQMMPRQNF